MRLAKIILRLAKFILQAAEWVNASRKKYFPSRIFRVKGRKAKGNYSAILFLVQTQRRRDAEISFLEFDRDLESKTPYKRF